MIWQSKAESEQAHCYQSKSSTAARCVVVRVQSSRFFTHHVVPLLVHAEQQPELLVPFVDHDVDPLRELEGNDDDEMR